MPLKVKGMIRSACVACSLACVWNLMKNCSPGTWIFIELKPKTIRTLVDCSAFLTAANQGSRENNLKLILEISVNNFPFFQSNTVWETRGESRVLGLGYVLRTNLYWRAASCQMTLFCLFTQIEVCLTILRQRVNLCLTSCQIDQVQALSWPVSQQIIWGQNVLATSATLYRLSPQSPVSILALLTSSPWNIEFLSTVELTQNSGPRRSTGYISVLNKRHWCQNCAAVGGGCVEPRRALVVQTVVGDNFVCKSHCMTKTPPHRSLWCPSLSVDPRLSSSAIFHVKSYI